MDVTSDQREQYDALLRVGARRLTWHARRLFQAKVCRVLCGGNPRRAERRFGWGWGTWPSGCGSTSRGAVRGELRRPWPGRDIRNVADPAPAPAWSWGPCLHTILTPADVGRVPASEKGWRDEDLSEERAMRSVLSRMGCRFERVREGRPLEKARGTDAVVANVEAARRQ